jgi:multiple sugar transport system permease protein
MATTLAPTPVEHPDAVDNNKPKRGGRRAVLYVFLTAMALTWVFPVAWAVFNSFRDYDYTSINGYVSFGGFTAGQLHPGLAAGRVQPQLLELRHHHGPSVLVTLLLASCVAFVVARFSFRFNIVLLGMFTAANLLPQQALLVPLYKLYNYIEVPFWFSESGTLYNSHWS